MTYTPPSLIFIQMGSRRTRKFDFVQFSILNPLARAAKALVVSTDHQRLFSDVKILTDIRYAFRPSPEAEPYGATIIHILRIHHHENTEHKNFFVALDDSDLATLIKVAERAQLKAKRLRADLSKAGVRYLGKEEENK